MKKVFSIDYVYIYLISIFFFNRFCPVEKYGVTPHCLNCDSLTLNVDVHLDLPNSTSFQFTKKISNWNSLKVYLAVYGHLLVVCGHLVVVCGYFAGGLLSFAGGLWLFAGGLWSFVDSLWSFSGGLWTFLLVRSGLW